MKHQSDRRPAIFVLNDPTAPRLNPELAKEIGLNESLLFLQLEFWLRQSGTLQEDGQYWIYESLTDIQTVFSFWSRETINRIIHSLIEQELLQVGNWNAHAYDRTRWFTLNRAGVDRLKSVKVFDWWLSQPEIALSQNETRLSQNETALSQNETTIPDLSTDLSPDLSSEKEEPPTAAFPKNPAQERLDRLRSKMGDNVLGVAAHSAKARAQAEHPDFADPSHDVDQWDRPFQYFCVSFRPGLQVEQLPEEKRKNSTREIERLAGEVHASPEQAAEAMPLLAQLEPWLVGPTCTPYKASWAEGFQNVLISDRETLQAQIDAKAVNASRKEEKPTGWAAFVKVAEREGVEIRGFSD